MHRCHIDGLGYVGLGIDLRQELNFHEENCMYGGLQYSACISDTLHPEVIAMIQEYCLPGQVLQTAGPNGFERGLFEGHQD